MELLRKEPCQISVVGAPPGKTVSRQVKNIIITFLELNLFNATFCFFQRVATSRMMIIARRWTTMTVMMNLKM